MQIVVRYKDPHSKESIGIPVQIIRDDQQDEYPHYYVIYPVVTNDDAYCEVHIAMGEIEEWKILGKDTEFSTRLLKKDELLIMDPSLEEDMYCVWDDGAKQHMERARNVYRAFKSEIEKYDWTAEQPQKD